MKNTTNAPAGSLPRMVRRKPLCEECGATFGAVVDACYSATCPAKKRTKKYEEWIQSEIAGWAKHGIKVTRMAIIIAYAAPGEYCYKHDFALKVQEIMDMCEPNS